MPPASTPLDHALEHAARGRPVFPCREGGDKAKAPYLPGESAPNARDGGHWLASSDEAVIRGWWGRWPRAVIGLPTGLRSRSVVVDLDPKSADPFDMLRALSIWCGGLKTACAESGAALGPAVSQTRSGGFHLWFRYPAVSLIAEIAAETRAKGVPFEGVIGCRNGLFRRHVKAGAVSALLDNIDVRGEGGYVIAPPSVMDDGRAYQWIARPEKVAPLPRVLARLICRLSEPEAARPAPPIRTTSPRVAGGGDTRARRYAEKAIDNIAAELSRASKGQRGTATFAAASSAGRFVELGIVPADRVRAALEAACTANGLVAQDGIASVRREIENGLAAAAANVGLSDLAQRIETMARGAE